MTMAELIAAAELRLSNALAERSAKNDVLVAMRSQVEAGDASVTVDQITEAVKVRDAAAAKITAAEAEVAQLRADLAEDERVDKLSREFHPTGVTRNLPPASVRVGQEARTYRPDQDKRGAKFISDVVLAKLGDFSAHERLSRHMTEERVERADWFERVATTTAFSGLVVPQYLTDLVAPNAKAGRPLANVMRHKDLPMTGMTVNLSRVTTGTGVDVQTQGNAVAETDIDDTLLTFNVQTVAGSQTVTRQAVERGSDTLDTTLEDLTRSYFSRIDSTVINQAATGLANVATAIAYTDGTPTAAELYPKLLAGPAAVEASLLDQSLPGSIIAVMHSRRWYWLQSQLSSTFPLIAQGFSQNVAGVADGASTYGSGFRGILPSGIAVIVDNNVATNLGVGVNEDEIYFASRDESWLWEDPDAPLLIRTETGPSVKSLGVDVVMYGYIAYTFGRQPHAQKVNGTGLVVPVF